MARISGLEKKDAPWHLRWFYGVMRKMFGKDFTPAKIQMRLPGLVWGGIAMEAGLGRNGLSRCATFNSENPRRALTDTPSNVSDELYARLRNQFSEEQLMQLGAQIAFENYRARWNRLFNVESDNLHQGTVS